MASAAVFLYEGDIVLLRGSEACSLFAPGLKLENRQGWLRSHLLVTLPSGETVDYHYRHSDVLLGIIDTTYDYLDYDLANLPVALPGLAERNRDELVAEWTAAGRAKAAPPPTP